MQSNEIIGAKKAIAGVSTEQPNEEMWMNTWCNSNWGDLLQPAPLSVALLGSMLVIASDSSTNDLSPITPTAATPTTPGAATRLCATCQDSFNSRLLQTFDSGYKVFEGAHAGLEHIRDASSQLPEAIITVVKTVVSDDPEAKTHLPGQIEEVLDYAEICQTTAHSCELAFTNFAGLAHEMVVACAHKVETDEQKMEEKRVSLEELKVQYDQEEKAVKAAEDDLEMRKKLYLQAEEDLRAAVDRLPNGLDLVGINDEESLRLSNHRVVLSARLQILKAAIEKLKFVVDLTRKNLKTSHDVYDAATKRLAEIQEAIANATAALGSDSLKEMSTVLTKGVAEFTTLRGLFSQISQFFDSIVSLLVDFMELSVDCSAGTMTCSETYRMFTKQLIRSQMEVPLRISLLAENVSSVYVDVSTNFILPAQRIVGQMLQSYEESSPGDKAALQAKLHEAQTNLQSSCEEVTQQISQLVEGEQEKFADVIENRLDSIAAQLEAYEEQQSQELANTINGRLDSIEQQGELVGEQEKLANGNGHLGYTEGQNEVGSEQKGYENSNDDYLGSNEQEREATLELLSANFGGQNITPEAKTVFADGRNLRISTTDLSGLSSDPWPMQVKSYAILLKDTTTPSMRIFACTEATGEHTLFPGPITLSQDNQSTIREVKTHAPPADSLIEIVAIVWGRGIVESDAVYDYLYGLAKTGSPLSWTNANLGGDTWPNVKKTGVIFYRNVGEDGIKQLSGRENEVSYWPEGQNECDSEQKECENANDDYLGSNEQEREAEQETLANGADGYGAQFEVDNNQREFVNTINGSGSLGSLETQIGLVGGRKSQSGANTPNGRIGSIEAQIQPNGERKSQRFASTININGRLGSVEPQLEFVSDRKSSRFAGGINGRLSIEPTIGAVGERQRSQRFSKVINGRPGSVDLQIKPTLTFGTPAFKTTRTRDVNRSSRLLGTAQVV